MPVGPNGIRRAKGRYFHFAYGMPVRLRNISIGTSFQNWCLEIRSAQDFGQIVGSDHTLAGMRISDALPILIQEDHALLELARWRGACGDIGFDDVEAVHIVMGGKINSASVGERDLKLVTIDAVDSGPGVKRHLALHAVDSGGMIERSAGRGVFGILEINGGYAIDIVSALGGIVARRARFASYIDPLGLFDGWSAREGQDETVLPADEALPSLCLGLGRNENGEQADNNSNVPHSFHYYLMAMLA